MPNSLPDKLFQVLAAWPIPRQQIVAAANSLSEKTNDQQRWSAIAAALDPDWPVELHQAVHAAVFVGWNEQEQGPRPIWFPDEEAVTNSNAAKVCADQGWQGWAELHAASVSDREQFWAMMINRLGIEFSTPPDSILKQPCDPRMPHWLPGAKLNLVRSCVASDPQNPAVPAIRWGKTDGTISDWSNEQLQQLSARVAAGLRNLDLTPGEAVAIDMPMTPESVAIYLGIIQAGCIVVSIADSFAAEEIATRLRISQAKLIFSQDIILRAGKTLPLYEKVIAAQAPRCVVLPAGDQLQTLLREKDIAWHDFLIDPQSDNFTDRSVYHAANPDEIINVLFSSGTTGEPKAIPWTQTTPIKSAVDGHLHLDIQQGDVVCWPTNLGWMMGPWLIFASLLNRATIALYEGPPTGASFAKFVEKSKVTMLGLVPSMVKNWRQTDCLADADWRCIRYFGSTGECSNRDDYFWLSSRTGYRPVIEYCGGTEIGGGYVTGSPLQPQSPSTFSTAAVGLDLVLLNEEQQPADSGEVFLIGPSIGLSNRLLNRDHLSTYFANTPFSADGNTPLRRHGDQMTRLANGYYQAEGRADDTMNLGGIKTSSAEIERVLLPLAGIEEVAAVAVVPQGGGPSELVVFAVVDSVSKLDADDWLSQMQSRISSDLNPLFRLSKVILVDQLPRTASNKIMRRKIRDLTIKEMSKK